MDALAGARKDNSRMRESKRTGMGLEQRIKEKGSTQGVLPA